MATSSVPDSDSGHQFASGFFLGILGGAVGMFVLGTKQGHELLDAARQSWSVLQKRLEEELPSEPLQALPAETTPKTKKTSNFTNARFPKFRRF